MAATTNGGQDVPVGMQRLSCLPCRKRKSKCDRVQPCSSCVLRSTENFCYTSASVDSIKPSSLNEKRKSIPVSSPSASSTTQRTVKAKRSGDIVEREGKVGDSQSVVADRGSVLSAITSIKGILRGLEAQLGHVESDALPARPAAVSLKVVWDDLKAELPSKADCDILLDCFLTEATWICVSIHPPSFRRSWEAFVNGQSSTRLFVSLAIFCMATGLHMAPTSHPAFRIASAYDHKDLLTFGYTVLNPISNPFLTLPETTERMQAQLMLCYYMSMTGWLTPGYQEQGVLLRCARAIHLFDESKWDFSKMSDWEVELRRRMAHNTKLGERWMSMFHLRLPVMPLMTNNKDPDFFDDDEYDLETGMLRRPNGKKLQAATYQLASAECARNAFRTTHYLYNFARWTSAERYAAAKEVDNHIQLAEDTYGAGPLKYEQACNLGTLTSPAAYRLASQSLITYSSLKRLRCTVMRQFLLDTEAPLEMRVAALEHAKSIIETVPVLIAVASSPWIAFNTSWCSSHLFCAASTFALVYLSEGEQYSVSASNSLDWFAKQIFDVIDTLSILGAKDRIAKQCEELLIALCTSRGTLKDKFASSKTGMRQRRWSGDDSKQSGEGINAGEGQKNSSKTSWPSWCDIMASDVKTKELLGDMHESTIIRSSKQTAFPAVPATQNDPNRLQTSLTSSPSVLRNQATGGTKIFASSPEQITANTPAAYSSDSRTSITDDNGEQSGNLWPALNDTQWNTLISSLDGDWSSMLGTVQATGGGPAAAPIPQAQMIFGDLFTPSLGTQWDVGPNEGGGMAFS